MPVAEVLAQRNAGVSEVAWKIWKITNWHFECKRLIS